MPDDLPQRRLSDKLVASFTKEQTAEFLGGGELGRPKWTDPKEQRRQDNQRKWLREALEKSVVELEFALSMYSVQTRDSLRVHFDKALQGDVDSYKMFLVMLGELTKQALQP